MAGEQKVTVIQAKKFFISSKEKCLVGYVKNAPRDHFKLILHQINVESMENTLFDH